MYESERRLTPVGEVFKKWIGNRLRNVRKCVCKCGNEIEVEVFKINTNTKSCGCLRKDIVAFQRLPEQRKLRHRVDRELVKDLYNKGLKQVEIAKIAGCSDGTVRTIIIKEFGLISKFQNSYYGNKNNCWKGYGEISGKFFSGIRHGAKERNLEFNINIEYIWKLFLKQERKCALSGLELVFAKTAKEMDAGGNTASLDRIDSSKGYIENNVQWIHKDLQWMKNDFDEKDFLLYCKLIYEYRIKCV